MSYYLYLGFGGQHLANFFFRHGIFFRFNASFEIICEYSIVSLARVSLITEGVITVPQREEYMQGCSPA